MFNVYIIGLIISTLVLTLIPYKIWPFMVIVAIGFTTEEKEKE